MERLDGLRINGLRRMRSLSEIHLRNGLGMKKKAKSAVLQTPVR